MKKISIRNAIIFFNPISGSGKSRKCVAFAKNRMLQDNWNILAAIPTEPSVYHQRRLTEKWVPKIDRIIVIGGDGTLRDIINTIPENSKVEIALIPTGNANVIARELQIPLNQKEAISLASSGLKNRKLDLGVLVTHDQSAMYFLAMLEIGYGSVVSELISHIRKGSFAKIYKIWADAIYLAAGIISLIKFLFFPSFMIMSKKKCIVKDINTAIFCNSMTYAKGWSFAPKALCDDGLIDLVVFKGKSPIKVLNTILSAITINKKILNTAQCYKAAEYQVQSHAKLPVQIDGEFVGKYKKIKIAVIPNAITLVTA